MDINCLYAGLTKVNANWYALLQNMTHADELHYELAKAIRAYEQAILSTVARHEVENFVEWVKGKRKRVAMLFTR